MGLGTAGRARIEEVAARAGVSRSTVSRVVNGSTAVSSAALLAVQRAIGELDYVPNRAARSLASRQTRALALVIPEDTGRFFGDPFFAALVAGVTDRLRDSDYLLNLIIASDAEGAKAARYLRGGGVDGAIVASHHTSDTFLDSITEALPLVYGGRPTRVVDTDYYVDVDNVRAAGSATEYLLERGHRRIGMIAGPATMAAATDRIAGFREAMDAAGAAIAAIEDGDFTEGGGAAAMRRILDDGPLPDALFIASDLMARGALRVLREAGISVPDDVAVIGFDDSPLASSPAPALTSVRQPSFAQGRCMAGVLLDLLAGSAPAHVTILPTEIVVRASA